MAVLRTGIRADEQLKLVKFMQFYRAEGLGPEEAWNKAVREAITQVHPDTILRFKNALIKQVEGLPPPPRQNTSIFDRVEGLNQDINDLRGKLKAAGEREEAMQAELAKSEALQAELVKLRAEREQLIVGGPLAPTQDAKKSKG